MSLRIAFDLDGVIADMEAELERVAASLFGTPDNADRDEPDGPPADAPLVTLDLTARQQRRLWQRVRSIENFWERLGEVDAGIVARLAAIAATRRWEVIFLTTRPQTAGRTTQVQSQRWLAANGFPLPSVFVVRGSRGRVASALGLDIVVDDRLENCLDVVVDSTARAILVWPDDERRLPSNARQLGIGIVKSTDECLRILAEADSAASERSGILTRVMRALGLKETAGA